MPQEWLLALFGLHVMALLGQHPGGEILKVSGLPLIGNKLHPSWMDHFQQDEIEAQKARMAAIFEDEDAMDDEEEDVFEPLQGESILDLFIVE